MRVARRGKNCRFRGLLAIDRLLGGEIPAKRSIGKMRGKLHGLVGEIPISPMGYSRVDSSMLRLIRATC
jgi:hypothetical protein